MTVVRAGTPDRPRPQWLKKYALVTGEVRAAPLDFPARFEQVLTFLKAAGWRVVVRSVGTDFGAVPVPRDQPVELYLWRAGPFTPEQAEQALTDALASINLNYSAGLVWLSELKEHVLDPSVADVRSAIPSRTNLAMVLAAAVAVLWLMRGRS